jgi:hypothetical protein
MNSTVGGWECANPFSPSILGALLIKRLAENILGLARLKRCLSKLTKNPLTNAISQAYINERFDM